MFILYLFLIGIFAGLLGSIIGIGGGVIIVPVLALLFNIPIHTAIGTSIIAVMVTSLSASIRFLKKELVNIPVGLALEIPTTIGGIAGSLTVAYLKNNVLFFIFGSFALLSGILTFLKNRAGKKMPAKRLPEEGANICANNKPLSIESAGALSSQKKASIFDSVYYDKAAGKNMAYNAIRFPAGLILSFFAGLFSGLLGVGGGVLKVPAMNILMNIPVKVAVATSNYMIGITAFVSSIIYFYNGFIDFGLTFPVAAGVLIGATAGSYATVSIKSKYIISIILIVFTAIGFLMFLRALNILIY